MPKRHGLFRQEGHTPPWFDVPWFLVGITDIFEAIARSDFIAEPDLRKQAQSLEHHFRSVKDRLAHSLDLFQRSVLNWETFFNTPFGTHNSSMQTLNVNSGVTAESVMTYINMFLDDVARVIQMVLGPSTSEVADSFGKLKGLIKDGHYPVIKKLFDELDISSSWWDLALKKNVGIRQRLIHYTDVINFRGQKQHGDDKFRVLSTIQDPVMGGREIEFLGSLQSINTGLCDWLDRLEQLLSTHLALRASDLGITWAPSKICPGMPVPIEFSIGIREIPENFLFLPLCEGSASSKCLFEVVKASP